MYVCWQWLTFQEHTLFWIRLTFLITILPTFVSGLAPILKHLPDRKSWEQLRTVVPGWIDPNVPWKPPVWVSLPLAHPSRAPWLSWAHLSLWTGGHGRHLLAHKKDTGAVADGHWQYCIYLMLFKGCKHSSHIFWFFQLSLPTFLCDRESCTLWHYQLVGGRYFLKNTEVSWLSHF